MNEMKVNAFIAALTPPAGTAELTAYVRGAVKALGGRSDADLARTMGIAPSTLASWKSRGAVPQEYVIWFTSTLADKIISYNADLPQVGLTARAVVLQFVERTVTSPRSALVPIYNLARILGGLLALAEFLASRSGGDLNATDVKTVLFLADTLEGAWGRIARLAGPPGT